MILAIARPTERTLSDRQHMTMQDATMVRGLVVSIMLITFAAMLAYANVQRRRDGKGT